MINGETKLYDGDMAALMEIRSLTVELPTAAGWVRPVNEVSLRIGEATPGSCWRLCRRYHQSARCDIFRAGPA
jgi:hypothetical protein